MKKIFAAAALLLAMTACGGSQKKALPLEGTTWKLAKMEAIPAKAIDAEADFFTLQFSAADTLVSGRTNCNRFFGKYELKGQKLGERLLIPCNMLRVDEDVFLDDYTVADVEKTLQEPLNIVKSSGQNLLDTVLGREER